MLYRVEKLIGMSVDVSDGDIGKIKDIYFDDHRWAVRYLVIEMGNWLNEREVLISPFVIESIDWGSRKVHANLTKGEIEGSPPSNTRMPISRQHEVDLRNYYGYPEYWGGLMLWGATSLPMGRVGDAASEKSIRVESAVVHGDPHLRSIKEVTGCHLKASDDTIGHLQDFMVEKASWAIRYILVGTRDWWPGKYVLIPPQWLRRLDWREKSMTVDVARAKVRDAPEYDSTIKFSREYEESLFEHYDRPSYW